MPAYLPQPSSEQREGGGGKISPVSSPVQHTLTRTRIVSLSSHAFIREHKICSVPATPHTSNLQFHLLLLIAPAPENETIPSQLLTGTVHFDN